MPGLALTTEARPNCVIIRVDGYLDGDSGQQLLQLVEDLLCRGVRGIVVDFTRCGNINSLGVSSLIDVAIRIIEDFGGRLAFTGFSELQRKVLILAGIIPMAVAAPTLAEACRVAGGKPEDDDTDGGSRA